MTDYPVWYAFAIPAALVAWFVVAVVRRRRMMKAGHFYRKGVS